MKNSFEDNTATEAFFKSRPYFECTKLLKNEVCYNRDLARQSAMKNVLKVLRRGLGKMDVSVVKRMFLLWRSHSLKMARVRFNTYTVISGRITRFLMKNCFISWKDWVGIEKNNVLRDAIVDRDCEIIKKTDIIKGLHHEKLQLEILYEDQIKEMLNKIKALQEEIKEKERMSTLPRLHLEFEHLIRLLQTNFAKLDTQCGGLFWDHSLLCGEKSRPSTCAFKEFHINDVPEETIVIRWANYQINANEFQNKYLEGAMGTNLTSDWTDGKRILALLKALNFDVESAWFQKKHLLKLVIKKTRDFGINEGPILTEFDVQNQRADVMYCFLTHLMVNHVNLPFLKRKFKELIQKGSSLLEQSTKLQGSQDAGAISKFNIKLSNVVNDLNHCVDHNDDSHREAEEMLKRCQYTALDFQICRNRNNPKTTNDEHGQKKKSEFTKLIWEKLQGPLGKITREEEEAHKRLQQLEEVLKQYHYPVKSAFEYYAGRGGDASTMDAKEFRVFIQDIRVKDKKITEKRLRGYFVLANMEPEEMGGSRPSEEAETQEDDETLEDEDDDEKNDGMYNPTDELVPSEFVELLARIALDKYQTEPASCLNKLIEEHVLKYSAVNSDYLREYISSLAFQAVLKRLGKDIFAVFEYYSRMNSKCRNGKKDELFLSSREFIKLMDDMDMFKIIEPKRVRLIFRRAQTADDDADADDDEDALSFEEFLEAISVVALHTNADPYLPIATRIERFLVEELVAKNKKKIPM